MANSKDSDEMLHNAAFHRGLHCLPRQQQSLEKNYLEIIVCDPVLTPQYKLPLTNLCLLHPNRRKNPTLRDQSILTQQTLLATLGSVPNPSTRAPKRGFKYCSCITASGKISQILPIVQAPVSRTITLLSFNVSINIGSACSTRGFNFEGSGPSSIEPEKIYVNYFICFDALHPSQQFFSHVMMNSCIPGLNQY